jgi:hypothetical protein
MLGSWELSRLRSLNTVLLIHNLRCRNIIETEHWLVMNAAERLKYYKYAESVTGFISLFAADAR